MKAACYRPPCSGSKRSARGRGGGGGGGGFNYRGVVHGMRTALRREGIGSLYRGLLPRLLLKSLGGSIWYSTYQFTREQLRSA